MTEEYERIRELVEARIRTKLLIFRDATQLAYERKEYAPEVWGFAKEVATLILSANGIEIRADDQSIPKAEGWGYDEHWEGYDLCAELMHKEGFKRVIPKESIEEKSPSG